MKNYLRPDTSLDSGSVLDASTTPRPKPISGGRPVLPKLVHCSKCNVEFEPKPVKTILIPDLLELCRASLQKQIIETVTGMVGSHKRQLKIKELHSEVELLILLNNANIKTTNNELDKMSTSPLKVLVEEGIKELNKRGISIELPKTSETTE